MIDIDLQALLCYDGDIYVNNVKCAKTDVVDKIKSCDDDIIQINLRRNIVKIIVQPWMTQLNCLYNFHTTMNKGITMPSTVMYGYLYTHTDNILYAQLSVLPGDAICWCGYIPKTAVISTEVV